MIIIPEISAIYVRVPGNEDGSFSQAILNRYSQARILYNQMEVDGIPIEYKHFEKFGIVRDPIERLWNFYNDHKYKEATPFSQTIYGPGVKDYDFETWVLLSTACFGAETHPRKTREGNTLYEPNAIIHHIPENQKSQYFYLMPTSGASYQSDEAAAPANNEIGLFPHSHIQNFAQAMGIKELVCQENRYGPAPEIHAELTRLAFQKFFAWDYQTSENLRVALLMSDQSRTA